MAIPLNKEHKEAEQQASNSEREKFIASLPKKEQKKFRAVEKAMNILVEAKVPCYVFPYLPSFQVKNKNQCWQWNTLPALMEYDKKGLLVDESAKFNATFHEAFFAFFFNQFGNFFTGTTLTEKLESCKYFFFNCILKHQEYLKEGSDEDSKSSS